MEYPDEILTKKIDDLKYLIQTWAEKRGVWSDDDCFKTALEHFNEEPSEFPEILVLISGGTMRHVCNNEDEENSEDFENLIDSSDFYLEHYDSCTIVFYLKEDKLLKPFQEYFEWKWICSLLKPNYTELYEEVFKFIGNNPQKLHDLEHRQFEVFVHELFNNQGYEAELGAGSGDGGVDVKIFKKDEIDQVVTLIQVKKYNEKHPIKLEAVAALNSHVIDQKANRGLFITTSRYLPGVQSFADRQNKQLILANKTEIKHWSKNVATSIIRDKSELIKADYLRSLIQSQTINELQGRIVHASIGYNMIKNDFGLILKETKFAVLIIRLRTNLEKSLDPPHNFRGYEIPRIDESIVELHNRENVFRAQISIKEDGSLNFWGQRNLYSVWDGKPKYFDFLD